MTNEIPKLGCVNHDCDACKSQQNLSCKSTQARLAASWGYVKAIPLTDEQIHAIYDKVASQEPYMGAVTRRNVVRAIEAAHGINCKTTLVKE